MNRFMDGLTMLGDDFIGNALVKIFHTIALFAIGAAIVWAGSQTPI